MNANDNKKTAAAAENVQDQNEALNNEQQAQQTVRAMATAEALANSKAFRITRQVVNAASTIGGLIAVGAAAVWAKDKYQARGRNDDIRNDGDRQ